MTLDGRTEPVHGRAGDRGDREHRVRIAHRHRADLHFGARDRERIDVRFGGGFEGQRLRIEIGRTHVHGDEVGVVNAGADEAGGTVEHDFAAAVTGAAAALRKEATQRTPLPHCSTSPPSALKIR